MKNFVNVVLIPSNQQSHYVCKLRSEENLLPICANNEISQSSKLKTVCIQSHQHVFKTITKHQRYRFTCFPSPRTTSSTQALRSSPMADTSTTGTPKAQGPMPLSTSCSVLLYAGRSRDHTRKAAYQSWLRCAALGRRRHLPSLQLSNGRCGFLILPYWLTIC